MNQPDKIILASASPRRAELLAQIQVEFLKQPVDVDESWRSGETPLNFVTRLAVEKAQAVAQGASNYPVLGSDTIVVIGEQILGKPADSEDAFRMLKMLSGETHRVMTAVALKAGDEVFTRVSISEVTFASMSDNETKAYVETGESLDKAGAYAIQGIAAQFISDIKGSYSGIMGLPLYETRELLIEHGITVLGR